MTFRPALGALAAALLLSVTACGPLGMSLEAEGSETHTDLEAWANQQFSEKQWGAPDVNRASGGLGPGAGMEFTPEKAGWYSIGMACGGGASSMTVTVTAADGDLGTGSTDCSSEVTTTMELPASKVTIAVEGAETKGMWALAVAPTETP